MYCVLRITWCVFLLTTFLRNTQYVLRFTFYVILPPVSRSHRFMFFRA